MKRRKAVLTSSGPPTIPQRVSINVPRIPVRSSGTLVVISHYDCRPLKDLHRILKNLAEHEAGRAFDVCVVVNRESGRPVDLPKLPFAVTVLARPNTGMNIGAWDYGWRENPGYNHYIFLQDECVILRNEWLQGLVKGLLEPGVGMVGECVNWRWCKPWTELTTDGGNGSQQQKSRTAHIVKRANLCLQFMETRNIPPGETARHLRSVAWGFSKEVLQRLKGFPIGQDYDECIVAEIAVSRQVESFGLSVSQAHVTPFYYVGHKQWINTYPGFCASLEYANWVRKHFSSPSFPFLSHVGKGDTPSRLDQLVKRVDTERGLFDGGVILPPRCGFVCLLAVLIDRVPTDGELALTILSWCLQSAPHVDLLLVATNSFLRDKTRSWMAKPEYNDFSQVSTCLLSEWTELDLKSYQFVLFARPGDQLHPSLASALTVIDTAEKPDIVMWNEQRSRRSDPGAWLFCQPRLEPLTMRSLGYIGMAFAVRPSWIKGFPYDFADDLLNNDSHLFHLWLSQSSTVRWTTHPEILSSRLLKEHDAVEASQFDYEGYRSTYKKIVTTTNEFEVFPSRNGHHRRYPLTPIRRARSVSVIVPFRDRPKETIECLRSVVGQRIEGHLETILINNRSSEESLAEVSGPLEVFRAGGADIKMIDYDGPFNHSRQTNLGVRASSGEVLVFLNNDAELLDMSLLEEISAWAMLPDIGTVGCQIQDAKGRLLCAGIRARLAVPGLQASLVEESREPSFSGQVREVFANTFACAVIARSKFESVGWLNDIEFPNGYNDVEYCLRSRKAGYRNLYLGHLQVKHTPGTSRGRCDETFQKILLRRRYPELSTDGMFQLSYEWRPEEGNAAVNRPSKIEETSSVGVHIRPVDKSGRKSALSDETPPGMVYAQPPLVSVAERDDAPLGMKKALKVLYKAMVYWVERRVL